MKAIDIALKDLTRSFRSTFAIIFMFGVPLLVTGMLYLMFGNIARDEDFDLPRTKVIVANLDAGGPKFQVNPKNIPGGRKAETMGDLVVSILESDEMADLIEVTHTSSAQAARTSVDNQEAQVAIVIPPDFSEQFADIEQGKAVIEFYQDPTLTIGPAIMRSILNRFLDGMAGVKIAVDVFMDEADPSRYALTAQVVQGYLDTSLALSEDPAEKLPRLRVGSIPFALVGGTAARLGGTPATALQRVAVGACADDESITSLDAAGNLGCDVDAAFGDEQTENPRLANQAIKGARLESTRLAQSAGTGKRRERVVYWYSQRVKERYAEIRIRTEKEWGLSESVPSLRA